MAYDATYLTTALKEHIVNTIKDELKVNRIKMGPWRTIESYPCKSQVILVRDAVPIANEVCSEVINDNRNGYHEKWNRQQSC